MFHWALNTPLIMHAFLFRTYLITAILISVSVVYKISLMTITVRATRRYVN